MTSQTSIEIPETDCSGYSSFPYPTHSGYTIFEVYRKKHNSGNIYWFWSEYDDYTSAHVGFEDGPYETSSEAYNAALRSVGFPTRR